MKTAIILPPSSNRFDCTSLSSRTNHSTFNPSKKFHTGMVDPTCVSGVDTKEADEQHLAGAPQPLLSLEQIKCVSDSWARDFLRGSIKQRGLNTGAGLHASRHAVACRQAQRQFAIDRDWNQVTLQALQFIRHYSLGNFSARLVA